MTDIRAWQKEFDDRFGIYSNYADVCPDKEEYIEFITDLLASHRTSLLQQLEGMRMTEHPCLKDTDYPHDDCISGIAHMEGHNRALATVEEWVRKQV